MAADCARTPHACAVCWEKQTTHADWYEHATIKHGAVMGEFGYDRPLKSDCPGENHAHHLPGYGSVRIKHGAVI